MAERHMNVAKLVGTVEGVSDGTVLIKTVTPTGRNGADEEILVPVFADKQAKKGLSGKRIAAIVGFRSIEDEEGRRRTVLVPLKPIELAEGEGPWPASGKDVNVAKIVGRTAGPYRLYDDPERGSTLGNLLIRAGADVIRSVQFGALASKLYRTCTMGSLVEFQGMVNRREYDRPDGSWDEMIEVRVGLGHEQSFRVLQKAKVVDEFADLEDGLGTQEIEAPDAEEATGPVV